MQKITVDLIRLAVSGAVICAVVGAAELEAFTIAISSRPRRFASHRLFIRRQFLFQPAAVLGDERAVWRSNDAGSAKRAGSDCAILRERRAGATPPQRTRRLLAFAL